MCLNEFPEFMLCCVALDGMSVFMGITGCRLVVVANMLTTVITTRKIKVEV